MDKKNLPIYKIIEGKLVRVIGDKRDHSKRYSQVVDVKMGRTYLREFTDEEEAQRDKEEEEWERNRPIREAEAKRKEEESKEFKEGLIYEQRITAFLDILGWRNFISQSLDDAEKVKDLGVVLDFFGKYSSLVAEINNNFGEIKKWNGDPQITHFSDCIVISVLVNNMAEENILQPLKFIVESLISSGFLLRGAISQGPLFHRGAIIYGPALIRSYELESKEAVNPRIILDKDLENRWKNGIRYQNKDGTLIGYKKNWKQDKDGRYFYDFIRPFFDTPEFDIDYSMLDYKLQKIRAIILENIGVPDLKIRSKYEWMVSYFNEKLEEYSGSSVKRITF